MKINKIINFKFSLLWVWIKIESILVSSRLRSKKHDSNYSINILSHNSNDITLTSIGTIFKGIHPSVTISAIEALTLLSVPT